jgi:transposase
VPKPSHLRSVNPTPAPRGAGREPLRSVDPTPAPATQGVNPVRSVDPTPAPAAQGAAPRPSGVAVETQPKPLRSADPTSAPTTEGVSPHPSGVSVEVRPRSGKRRSFSAAEKLRIVRAAAACTIRGEVEALLRREGIYSSLLAAWRKELALHGSEALAGRKPGRKPKLDAKDRRIAELEKRALRLEAKLSLAEKLIDLQKKVSAILGINLASDGESS